MKPRKVVFDRDKITQARERRGWNQSTLAHACYVSRSTVSRWESGECVPTATHLAQLAYTLGHAVTYFFRPLWKTVNG